MEIKIVRDPTKRELWLDDRRIYLTLIGDGWGECSEEVAEREMQECLEGWQKVL